MDLQDLRQQLAGVDEQLLRLVAERRDLVREIGRRKRTADLPMRDFDQERVVLERARSLAENLGLPESLSDKLMQLVIGHALTTQEHERVSMSQRGTGKSALVIGGSGRMGHWFTRFLLSQGFAVEIVDPNESAHSGIKRFDSLDDSPVTHDFIVIATPLRVSERLMDELAVRRPEGVVFDIGSLKTPLRSGLRRLQDSGVRVTSMHPMFGPDTELLAGRHVIIIDLDDQQASEEARSLFASTMAGIVEMSLDEHDRLISFVLGLSHALNIVFFSTLARSGEPAARLAQLSSTTFDQQLTVAARVAEENPNLYFEIQHLNQYGATALEHMRTALNELVDAVASADESGFVELMTRGRAYLRDLAGQ